MRELFCVRSASLGVVVTMACASGLAGCGEPAAAGADVPALALLADGGVPSASAGQGRAPVPSAGCAKGSVRPAGGQVTLRDRIYELPATYDGTSPMPLLLGLHAAGNPNTQLQRLTAGTPLQTGYVRVFPKSRGSAWSYDADAQALHQIIDDVLATYCIDTSRMFATGHSSGAQMLVQLLCHGEKRFAGVAPVAASRYCERVPAVPVMYIQGMKDAQRNGGNGADVVKLFTASNGCGAPPADPLDVPGCASAFDGMPVTPGCVRYRSCSEPTVWCSHNDNGYNATDGRQHGWPCFASSAIASFFKSLQ